MKKIIIIICMLYICGCTYSNKNDYNYTTEEEIEKEILTNLSEVSKVSDTTSSNPYDYTKNEYYKNIIDLGKNAVPVLENMYNNGKLKRQYQ